MIDFRSDTVTKPSPAMREAIARAKVGDDMYGEDPTVRELEEQTATLLGKPAGVFFPTGTQSNLAAVLSHCQRGDEYIIGDRYHIYCYEASGAAVLGGVSPCPLATDSRGGLTVDAVIAAIKDDDQHYPRTRLLCMENTFNGMKQDSAMIEKVVAAARERGLTAHLDGARLMNAAVAQNISAKQLAAPFSSVSLCLSKGLGAPAGTVLCGDDEFIYQARRNRKILGGSMRQSGILAAACLWALANNIERLQQDHQLAEELAQGLLNIPAVNTDAVVWDTNMVYFTPATADHAPLQKHWQSHNILTSAQGTAFRLVTHLDISAEDINHTIAATVEYYS